MLPLTIAVIGDVHVGREARARDLCPYPRAREDERAIDDGYRNRFLEFLRVQHIEADYLAIPGDVSEAAQPAELRLATALIRDISECLSVPMSRVLFVPGNHDVDWSVLSIDDPTGTRFRRTQRYDTLRDPETLFPTVMGGSQGTLLDDPHFVLWQDDALVAVGYNSAWHDEPSEEVHHGLVSERHLEGLDVQLGRLGLMEDKLKLFLVHHHPVPYRNPIPDEPDFSIMTNASSLLRLLAKHRFDLLIHGHQHVPCFSTYIIDSAFPLAILCSGSFSLRLDPRWSGYVNNQFHLVHVEGREDEDHHIFGEVVSWTYLSAHGWVPSERHNGMIHRESFGTYVLPEKVISTLRPFLIECFESRDLDYVEWAEIVERFPKYRHLPAGRVVEALDRLGAAVGFRRRGRTPEEIILLRGHAHDAR